MTRWIKRKITLPSTQSNRSNARPNFRRPVSPNKLNNSSKSLPRNHRQSLVVSSKRLPFPFNQPNSVRFSINNWIRLISTKEHWTMSLWQLLRLISLRLFTAHRWMHLGAQLSSILEAAQQSKKHLYNWQSRQIRIFAIGSSYTNEALTNS